MARAEETQRNKHSAPLKEEATEGLNQTVPGEGKVPQQRARFSKEHQIMLALLIQARKSAGLSQAALAKRLGKVQSHVAAVEVNGRDVTGVEIYRWCLATGLKFSDFAAQFEEVMETEQQIREDT